MEYTSTALERRQRRSRVKSGRSAAWLARYLGVVEVVGSNPAGPISENPVDPNRFTGFFRFFVAWELITTPDASRRSTCMRNENRSGRAQALRCRYQQSACRSQPALQRRSAGSVRSTELSFVGCLSSFSVTALPECGSTICTQREKHYIQLKTLALRLESRWSVIGGRRGGRSGVTLLLRSKRRPCRRGHATFRSHRYLFTNSVGYGNHLNHWRNVKNVVSVGQTTDGFVEEVVFGYSLDINFKQFC